MLRSIARSLHLQNYFRTFRTAEEQATKLITEFKKSQTPIQYPYSALYTKFDNAVIAGCTKNHKNASFITDGANYKNAMQDLTRMLPNSITEDSFLLGKNLEKHVAELNNYTGKLQFGDRIPLDKSINEIVSSIRKEKPQLYFSPFDNF